MTAEPQDLLDQVRDWAQLAAATQGLRDVEKARRTAGMEVLAILSGVDPQVERVAGWEPGQGLRDHTELFLTRLLQDMLSQATASYWERRAAVFEWIVAERPGGDFVGYAETEDSIAERRQRCLDAAAACRHRAALIRGTVTPEVAEDVKELLSR